MLIPLPIATAFERSACAGASNLLLQLASLALLDSPLGPLPTDEEAVAAEVTSQWERDGVPDWLIMSVPTAELLQLADTVHRETDAAIARLTGNFMACAAKKDESASVCDGAGTGGEFAATAPNGTRGKGPGAKSLTETDPVKALAYEHANRIYDACGRKKAATRTELSKPEHKQYLNVFFPPDNRFIESAVRWCSNQKPTTK